jgi:hypothetical protein
MATSCFSQVPFFLRSGFLSLKYSVQRQQRAARDKEQHAERDAPI